MTPSVHIIYASTSGNSEYVTDVLRTALTDADVEVQRVEHATPDDLLRGDVLILASGTWNTGGTEGSLNPLMHAFLREKAVDVDLRKKPMTFVSLGDDRYYYRTRCTEHFLRYQRERGGTLLFPPLILVNEPYGQEEKIRAWAGKLRARLARDGAAPAVN